LEGRSPAQYSGHAGNAGYADVVAQYCFVALDKTAFELIILVGHLTLPTLYSIRE